jgi:chemosensory pili system protein ChpA (sensor histidine kinase/response regulator)
MAQAKSGNYDALVWVQDEIQQSLSDALQTVTHFIESPNEQHNLTPTIQHLGQTHGVVDMLSLSGASMLLKELITSLSELAKKPENAEAIADTILKGLLLLPNYFKLINHLFEDHPLRLISTINELRSSRGDTAILPTSFFKPDLNKPLPDDIAALVI